MYNCVPCAVQKIHEIALCSEDYCYPLPERSDVYVLFRLNYYGKSVFFLGEKGLHDVFAVRILTDE